MSITIESLIELGLARLMRSSANPLRLLNRIEGEQQLQLEQEEEEEAVVSSHNSQLSPRYLIKASPATFSLILHHPYCSNNFSLHLCLHPCLDQAASSSSSSSYSFSSSISNNSKWFSRRSSRWLLSLSIGTNQTLKLHYKDKGLLEVEVEEEEEEEEMLVRISSCITSSNCTNCSNCNNFNRSSSNNSRFFSNSSNWLKLLLLLLLLLLLVVVEEEEET